MRASSWARPLSVRGDAGAAEFDAALVGVRGGGSAGSEVPGSESVLVGFCDVAGPDAVLIGAAGDGSAGLEAALVQSGGADLAAAPVPARSGRRSLARPVFTAMWRPGGNSRSSRWWPSQDWMVARPGSATRRWNGSRSARVERSTGLPIAA